jgi:hypothetical protein
MKDSSDAPKISQLGLAIHYSLSDGIPRRSICVAIIVGTVLNLINQGDAIFGAKGRRLVENRIDLYGALCGQHVWRRFLPAVASRAVRTIWRLFLLFERSWLFRPSPTFRRDHVQVRPGDIGRLFLPRFVINS